MKQLIVRIAEGMGNQMFMYAHAFSLAKKNNANLIIDNTSGYFKKKNQFRKYELNKFKITSNLCDNYDCFNTFLLDQKRKIFKNLDFFRKEKLFYIEKRSKQKKTFYSGLRDIKFKNKVFVEGYFQSEKYFIEHISDLRKEFTIKSQYLNNKNKYIDLLQKSNSISIAVRQNRYSEGKFPSDPKSKVFTEETINYIQRSVKYFKSKIANPKFFIWADDFNGLENYFNKNDFVFIHHDDNKTINDFNLFQYSKHFIVGPTPFHWWGAWLNNNSKKICVRPENINPSNNVDFWPNKWIPI